MIEMIAKLRPITGAPSGGINCGPSFRGADEKEERINQKARFVPESLEADFRVPGEGGKSR